MQNRPLVAVAVVALGSLALAGTAAAARPVPTPVPAAESGFMVTVESPDGRVIESRVGSAERVVIEAAAGSACATVDAWRRSGTLFGATAYVFHQVKHWCWAYPRITSVNVGSYFSDVDPNYLVRGTWGSEWFYTWRGSAQGGHYSQRQAQVENCVLHYGCLRTEYPVVEIWVNGNGAWTYNTSL
jgi:hypothetical protein